MGDADAGKTALLHHFTQNLYYPEYKRSLGASFGIMDIRLGDYHVKLVLWDIAGQASFQQVRLHYFSGAQGAILVYDISNPSTFMTLRSWMSDFWHIAPHGPIILIGNQMNSKIERRVPIQAGEMLERRWGTPFFETNTATGEGIEKAFSKIVSLILRKVKFDAN